MSSESGVKLAVTLESWLRTKADRIRSIQQSMCASAIELGRELAEVRSHCTENGYDRWADWVRDHCNVVRWQADKYIAVFERYCDLPNDVQARVGGLGIEKMYKLSLVPAAIDIVELLNAEVGEGRRVDDLSTAEVDKLVRYFQKNPEAVMDRLPSILSDDTIDKIAEGRVRSTQAYRALERTAEDFREKADARESKLAEAQGRETQLRRRVGELEEQLATARDGEVATLRAQVDDVQTELGKVQKRIETESTRRSQMFTQLGEQFRRAVMAASQNVQSGAGEVMASIRELVDAVGAERISASTASWALEQVDLMESAIQGVRGNLLELYANSGIKVGVADDKD